MNSRLTNTNDTVSQQKSPVILVVRDINENSSDKQFFIKNQLDDEISDDLDDESEENQLQRNQIAFYENKDTDLADADLIWSHKKPSDHDHNATEYFLQIRGSEKYKELFADKKYGKYKLWSAIAEEMNSAGFYVGEGRDAAERCRQKFSNLEKGFLNYVKLVRSGNRKKDPPPFYHHMVNLVDPDDKLYKQEQNAFIDSVKDSLHIELVSATSKDNILPSSSSKNNDQSDLSNFQTEHKIKKIKEKNEIISLLRKQHEEIMSVQKEFLEKIDKHLIIQNEQRERMITSFIEAMKDTNECNCKKRKRNESEETT